MPEEDVTIDSLTIKVLSYNPDADVELLRKAYGFSKEAHNSQKRIEGTPYINRTLS